MLFTSTSSYQSAWTVHSRHSAIERGGEWKHGGGNEVGRKKED